MTEVDPWKINKEGENRSVLHVIDSLNNCEFEDNFISRDKIQKLPDSAEYIASLEQKLAKIKSGPGSIKSEKKQLINSLEESHKSYMCRLISGDISCVSDQDLALDEPANLTTNWLRSQVNPEQALTVGELVELLKADYLAKESADHQEPSDPKESS